MRMSIQTAAPCQLVSISLINPSNLPRVLDSTESVFCLSRWRAMTWFWNRWMKDIESLYLDLLTNVSHQIRPSIDPVRFCGICQGGFALRPRWRGLDPEDPIEQRTISNGARAQRSGSKLNNTPNSWLDDGPTGVVIIRINITQLQNAVDGDNGGAIGCQLARFTESLELLL